MITIDSINNLLEESRRLLNEAAGQIRDLPLDPQKPNIRHIGNALVEITEIQIQIYALRPDLEPFYLKGPLSNPKRAFEGMMERVHQCKIHGANSTAIALLSRFLTIENTDEFHDQINSEINRLLRK